MGVEVSRNHVETKVSQDGVGIGDRIEAYQGQFSRHHRRVTQEG
jgi:hypothetical protein